MPTRSRNARTKARQKRTMSLLKRSLKQAAFEANKNFSTVLMLLAQAGGSIVVSQETIQSVIPTLPKASYATVNTDEGVRVYVVTRETDEPVATVDASVLPTESLDEMKARMDAAHNPRSVTSQLAAERTAREANTEDAIAVETEADPTPVDPTIAAGDPA